MIKKIKIAVLGLILSLFFTLFRPSLHAANNIKVYFNHPEISTTTSQIANPHTGLDESLLEFIESAGSDDVLYASFYRMTDETYTDAFNDALDRGATVYFMTDGNDGDSDAYDNIKSTKMAADSGDDHSMHNKFVVLKDSAVWTGSANLTSSAFYEQNNNAVTVYSKDLAGLYEDEFLYMWEEEKFSDDKDRADPGGSVEVDGVEVEVYFSPYGSNSRVISDYIDESENSIIFNMYTFSEAEVRIIDALKEAHDRDVTVKGVVDRTQRSTSVRAKEELSKYGLDVILDNNPYGLLHHKFVVIDHGTPDAKVITGSYNWTTQANSDHDENFLVIHSSAVAGLFWEEAQKNYSLGSGGEITRGNPAVDEVRVYPSPANFTDRVHIGYRLSAGVTDVDISIYTVSGEEVVNMEPRFYPGAENETVWDLKNSSGNDVAPGLYMVKVAGTTGDGTFYEIEKFAVVR